MLGSDLHGMALLLLLALLWPVKQGLQQITCKNFHETVRVGVVMDGAAGVEFVGTRGGRADSTLDGCSPPLPFTGQNPPPLPLIGHTHLPCPSLAKTHLPCPSLATAHLPWPSLATLTSPAPHWPHSPPLALIGHSSPPLALIGHSSPPLALIGHNSPPLAFSPAQYNEVEQIISFLHQIPGVPERVMVLTQRAHTHAHCAPLHRTTKSNHTEPGLSSKAYTTSSLLCSCSTFVFVRSHASTLDCRSSHLESAAEREDASPEGVEYGKLLPVLLAGAIRQHHFLNPISVYRRLAEFVLQRYDELLPRQRFRRHFCCVNHGFFGQYQLRQLGFGLENCLAARAIGRCRQ